MPLYTWQDENTGRKVEILRSIHVELKVPPTLAEVRDCSTAAEWTEEELRAARWVRVLDHAPRISKGPSWGPGKGYWAVLLTAALLGGCKTFDQWDEDDHTQIMRTCRMMCDPVSVRKYDIASGSCVCHLPQEE